MTSYKHELTAKELRPGMFFVSSNGGGWNDYIIAVKVVDDTTYVYRLEINREHGAQFNDVRLTSHVAAYYGWKRIQ